MNRERALERAKEIAVLVERGTGRLRRTRVGDLPLLAMLPLFKLGADAREGRELDIDALVPRILEILIFGSVADEANGEVGDIDMVLIDSGFFSEFFANSSQEEDWYEGLSDNLEMLLVGFLGFDAAQIKGILNTPVDLHIFPVQMLKSAELRSEIISRHKDPEFLRNCFGSMLRYDRFMRRFTPVDVAYFEQRYETELSDLK